MEGLEPERYIKGVRKGQLYQFSVVHNKLPQTWAQTICLYYWKSHVAVVRFLVDCILRRLRTSPTSTWLLMWNHCLLAADVVHSASLQIPWILQTWHMAFYLPLKSSSVYVKPTQRNLPFDDFTDKIFSLIIGMIFSHLFLPQPQWSGRCC